MSGSRRIRVHETGRYELRDDLLTWTKSSGDDAGKTKVQRVYGLRATADGRGRVLIVCLDRGAPVPFTARSSNKFTGTWYRLEP